MKRRTAIVALLSMPLGYFKAWQVNASQQLKTGILAIPLDQWTSLHAEYRGRIVVLTPREIFNALQENNT